ncbi:MAG: isochorismatase family protein [Synergistaceae bacterium]|nr:isochorismatase family protein [Synergistaceae bacterium]
MKDILVVDCQYDFINGTLACIHSEEAVKNIIAYINANPSARVFYSADAHSLKHCSYIPNGGTWPVHCQAGTHGAELHSSFTTDIINPEQRPTESNTFYKGTRDDREEYSAFWAGNNAGQNLCEVLGQDVLICGIATEFCVKETVKEFVYTWRNIEVCADMLGWVDDEGHKKTLEELSAWGAESGKISTVILGGHFGDSVIDYCCWAALESVFHEEGNLKPGQESMIDTITESAWGKSYGAGDPAKLLASAIAAAPDREHELRDAFADLGTPKNLPAWMVSLKNRGCRIVCMSEYAMKSEVFEAVRPEAPESLAGKYGLVPSECIFTADDEGLCEAAKAAGFFALPSPNMAHLRRALSKLFVKVDVHD